MYVICLDFHGEKSLDSHPLSSNFLHQLVQCSQFFQTCQINTIEHNLYYFHNLQRRFNKKLHRMKDQTLDAFIDQCQVRELLPEDRHLLKSTDHTSERIHQTNQRITRIGTFNDQHQIERNFIEKKIQQGFFCLICSKNDYEDLCSMCQIFPQIINDRSISIARVYIGQLMAKERTVIDYVVGKQPVKIQNSCFCNRYLLELCHQVDIYQVKEEKFDWINDSTSIEMSQKEFEDLQQFTSHYQIHVRSSSTKTIFYSSFSSNHKMVHTIFNPRQSSLVYKHQ